MHFPANNSEKNRKLSKPWHSPYHVTGINSPDISVTEVYYPQDKRITVHQSKVKYWQAAFPAGFYVLVLQQTEGNKEHPSVGAKLVVRHNL